MYVVADLEEYQANPEAYLAKNPPKIADELLKFNRPRTEWKLADLESAAKHLTGRSHANGKQMFQIGACISCHKMAGQGQDFGPDLTKLDPKWDNVEVLKHILDPSLKIDDKYRSYTFQLDSGKVVTGMILEETPTEVKVIENPLAVGSKPVVLTKTKIETRVKSPTSLMPKGLLDKLTRDEILDLLAYVMAKGEAKHKAFVGGDHKHGRLILPLKASESSRGGRRRFTPPTAGRASFNSIDCRSSNPRIRSARDNPRSLGMNLPSGATSGRACRRGGISCHAWGWLLALGLGMVLLGGGRAGEPAVRHARLCVLPGVRPHPGRGLQLPPGIPGASLVPFPARPSRGRPRHRGRSFLMVNHVGEAAAVMTLLLATFFLVGGLFRVLAAVALHFPNWPWTFVSGLVSVLLGASIWRQWPYDSFWVIGLFIGIELLFRGCSLVMLALAARRVGV